MKILSILTTVFVVYLTSNVYAFKGLNLFKNKVSKEGSIGKKKQVDLKWYDVKNEINKTVVSNWDIDLKTSFLPVMWMGTTFKDVPYTEREFNNLRNRRINEEMDRLKEEHIKKEKIKKTQESSEEVDSLLDAFLDEDEEEEVKEDANEDLKYLENFDERAVKRDVMNRLFIPQNRPVLTQAVYFQTQGSDLFCLDIKSGLTVWVCQIGLPIEGIPYESEKNIYLLAGGVSFVVDKRSGFIVYKSKIDRAVQSYYYGQGQEIYMGTYRGKILSWNPIDHYEIWNERLWGQAAEGVYGDRHGIVVALKTGHVKAYGLDGAKKWEFINKSISNNSLYLEKVIAEFNKKIVKERNDARTEDRKPDVDKIKKLLEEMGKSERELDLQKHAARGRYLAKPVVNEDDMFIVCTDYNMYVLNRFSGILKWNLNVGYVLDDVPHVYKKNIWLKDSSGHLYIVDRKKQKVHKKFDEIDEILGSSDRRVLVRTFSGDYKIFSRNGDTKLILPKKTTPMIHAELGIVLCINENLGTISQYRLVGE